MNIKSTQTFWAPVGYKKLIVLAAFLAGLSGCVVFLKSEKTTEPTKGLIDVKVHYTYPGKNELNTFDGFYKKEIEKGRYAQTNIKLDPGQQLLVLNESFVYKFFDMPESFTHKGEGVSGATHSLRIKADTLDRTVTWSGSLDNLEPKKFQLKELVFYIDSIVKSTDDYTGLPKSNVSGD